MYEQNANQIDRKLSEINDARICNSNWFFRARFFLLQQLRALMFCCCFALLFDHFILCFLFLVRFVCLSAFIISLASGCYTHKHTHQVHTQYTLLFSHGLFCSSQSLSHYLHRSLFEAGWPLVSPLRCLSLKLRSPITSTVAVCVLCCRSPPLRQNIWCYSSMLLSVSVCTVCIYLERFHHVLSYAHILIKRKIIAHKNANDNKQNAAKEREPAREKGKDT